MSARDDLEMALLDVDELILAHEVLTGGGEGGQGAPINRQGQAISRAAIVIIVANLEVFIEDCFEAAAIKFYNPADPKELAVLFSQTSEKLNHPSLLKVDLLFFNVGISHISGHIRWASQSNANFKKKYSALLDLRGRIAHGRKPNVRLNYVRQCVAFVKKFAERLEANVNNHMPSDSDG